MPTTSWEETEKKKCGVRGDRGVVTCGRLERTGVEWCKAGRVGTGRGKEGEYNGRKRGREGEWYGVAPRGLRDERKGLYARRGVGRHRTLSTERRRHSIESVIVWGDASLRRPLR